MNAELCNNGLEGLIEQIGQQLKTVKGADSDPSIPTPLPGSERRGGATGQWSFQFIFDDPHSIKMIVTVTTQTPLPVETKFSSQMDKIQVTKLIEWLNRILSLMDEPI